MAERLTPEREQEIRAARYQLRALSSADVDIDALLAEINQLRQQRKYLIDQLAKKDARSGEGDEALREFLNPDAVAGDKQPETEACQCRTDSHGDNEGWIKYRAGDGEFVELRCRDHKAGAR